jgi:hypothetical protein
MCSTSINTLSKSGKEVNIYLNTIEPLNIALFSCFRIKQMVNSQVGDYGHRIAQEKAND